MYNSSGYGSAPAVQNAERIPTISPTVAKDNECYNSIVALQQWQPFYQEEILPRLGITFVEATTAGRERHVWT